MHRDFFVVALVLMFWPVILSPANAESEDPGDHPEIANFKTAPSKPASAASSQPKIPVVSLSVKPGPLEAERRGLLRDIYEGKSNGIGIKNYLVQFQNIEEMAEKGEPVQNIQQKLDSMWNELDEQTKCIRVSKAGIRELTLEQARNYMVSIVNADRAKYRLPPVTLDPVASIAGQKHCEELTAKNYISHWNTQGKKPDQRYTESGGADNDSESIALHYGNKRSFKKNLISVSDLEKVEWALFSERPPKDGHRLNILRPAHNKLGIGLSYVADGQHAGLFALSQEFIDHYGEYSKLPLSIFRGKNFEVSGTLAKGVKLESVEIHFEAEPKQMSIDELKKTHSYSKASDFITDACVGNSPSDILVKYRGGREQFSCQFTPQRDWKPGLYYVMIYAVLKGENNSTLISTRTVHLK